MIEFLHFESSVSFFPYSHEEMKTQWEHPKTGKKKRCAGGLLYSNSWSHCRCFYPKSLVKFF